MTSPSGTRASRDALLVVDVQNDFLPGGVLAVPRGEVIEPLNDYIRQFARLQLPVFATRDWHPREYCSFREHGLWPAHCVAGTHGAKFPPQLRLAPRVQTRFRSC